MSLLNRVALTITRKQPYADWAIGTDGPVPIVTYPADNPRTIYLAPHGGLEPDLPTLLDEFWEPDRGSFSARQGLTLAIAARDRVLVGIMTTPDSPAAVEGHGLVFRACSSRCEKILRKEAARGLKRTRNLMRQ